jgi:hypothetical protein
MEIESETPLRLYFFGDDGCVFSRSSLETDNKPASFMVHVEYETCYCFDDILVKELGEKMKSCLSFERLYVSRRSL